MFPRGDLDLKDLREHLDHGEIISEVTLMQIFDLVADILILEENLGHGQYEDLLELFRVALTDIGPDPTCANFLFMGDYVDRGHYSLNTLLLLLAYIIERPRQFTLLRGNHESRAISQMYGFMEECLGQYGHGGIWSKCMDIFDLLPIAALTDENVFSIHGGLSPDLFSSPSRGAARSPGRA
jgi:hypothetical protein